MTLDPSKLGQGRGPRPAAAHYDTLEDRPDRPNEELSEEDQQVAKLIQQRQSNVNRMAASTCNGCQHSLFFRTQVDGPVTCMCTLSGRQMTPIAWCSRLEPLPPSAVS